jgi:hypothetical protein
MVRALCRLYPPAPLLLAAALLTLAAPAPVAAQAVIFDAGGFEAPTFSAGNITGQQGFQALPTGPAGTVQSGAVAAGTQAFQINGTQLMPNASFGDANFWYRSYTTGSAYNPVADNNPLVRVQYQGLVSGALPLQTDIPFAGPYLEGYTAGGTQQAITPVLFNLNGGLTVFTNTTVGGGDGLISTADLLVNREAWHSVEAQLNFSAQTFRVVLNGSPVTFTEGSVNVIDLPFRNSSGQTVSIAEVGLQGYYNSQFSPTLNSVYLDNFRVTSTAVPEPSTFALAGLGMAGVVFRRWRRKPTAA